MKKSEVFRGYLIPDEYLNKIQGAVKKEGEDIYVLRCPKCGGVNLIATKNLGWISVLCFTCKHKFRIWYWPEDK